MNLFLDKFSDKINGIISGFDRIILKGIFKNLNYENGMLNFLLCQKILFKDFGNYVARISTKFKEISYAYVQKQNKPMSR